MFNFEFQVEVEVSDNSDESYEYEYETDYQHHDNNYAYGGHGNHFNNEVEIQYEVQPHVNFNNWQSWGKKNNSWEVPWSGWYKQGGQKHNMYFSNFQTDANGNIWGHGSDDVGTFNISGKVNYMNNKKFTFHKQYYGAHTVIYKGNIKQGTNLWVGKWEIPGNCNGNFQLCVKAPKWKGAFWQQGNKTQMQLDMIVNNHGVYGNGYDSVGQFIIRGDVHGSHVNFYKQYMGAHTVLYSGELHNNNIKGHWQIPGNCEGKFHLHL